MSSTLISLMTEKMKKESLSERAAARQIGLSHSTINRILRGLSYDVPTLILICQWLRVRPSDVLDELGDNSVAQQIALILSRYPRLEKAFLDLADEPGKIEELLRYAGYLAQQ